jgi:uncharacterized protein (DUF302 family)
MQPVKVETLDIKTFNQLYNVKIKRNMSVEQVHQQLESIFSIRCGIVETDKNEALKKVLKSMDEYIINLENIYFLVVCDVNQD